MSSTPTLPNEATTDVGNASECTECIDDAQDDQAPQTKKQNKGRKEDRITTHLLVDGTLVGRCANSWCDNTMVSIMRFAPNADSHVTKGKRQYFDAAVAEFAVAWSAGDHVGMQTQRALIKLYRNQGCDTCALLGRKLSLKEQECKNEWSHMRWKACLENDGCANQACTERGMASWIAIQADHGTNPKKKDAKNNTVGLSQYKYWAYNGGVDAMREEEKRIQQWICGVCHAIEPTGTQGRGHDPADMPDGKRNGGSDDETKEYKRKHNAKVTFPKYEHVNKHKRGKTCTYEGCAAVCVAGNEVGFHWDHRVEGTKRKCRCLDAKGAPKGGCHGDPDCRDTLFGRSGGVSGLAHNHVKASALEHVAQELDAEMDKCELLCTSCHLSRKLEKRARWDETPPASVLRFVIMAYRAGV